METLEWLLLLLIALSTVNKSCAQGCEYSYTRQPPVTELQCNPYEATRLTLTCTVEGPNTPRFSIVWFRKRNGRADHEELKASQPRVEVEVTALVARFTRRSSRLTVMELNESNDVGDYWCQVRLENGTIFQEKSNILSLGAEEKYTGIDSCMMSNFIVQNNCIGTLQVTESAVIVDGNDTGPIMQTTSSDLFPIRHTTQSTAGPVEKNINLPAIYVAVGCTIIMTLLIILLSMCLAIVSLHKCKLKTNNQEDSNSHPGELESVTDNLTHSPVHSNQNEGFDYKANIAYDKVCQIILNENVSYAATDSHRFAPVYEEIHDSRPSTSHGSIITYKH